MTPLNYKDVTKVQIGSLDRLSSASICPARRVSLRTGMYRSPLSPFSFFNKPSPINRARIRPKTPHFDKLAKSSKECLLLSSSAFLEESLSQHRDQNLLRWLKICGPDSRCSRDRREYLDIITLQPIWNCILARYSLKSSDNVVGKPDILDSST
jgi:hypothetical protein